MRGDEPAGMTGEGSEEWPTDPVIVEQRLSSFVREGKPVLFAEARHALKIELYPVAGVKGRGRLPGSGLPTLGRLLEQALESSGGDYLQYPAQAVAGVPEGVPLVAGLEDEVTLSRIDDLIAELCPHTTLQDVAVLVLVRVTMERGSERSRGDRMLNEGEPTAGFFAPDHEPNAKRSEIYGLPITGPEDARALGAVDPVRLGGCRIVGGRHSLHTFLLRRFFAGYTAAFALSRMNSSSTESAVRACRCLRSGLLRRLPLSLFGTAGTRPQLEFMGWRVPSLVVM